VRDQRIRPDFVQIRHSENLRVIGSTACLRPNTPSPSVVEILYRVGVAVGVGVVDEGHVPPDFVIGAGDQRGHQVGARVVYVDNDPVVSVHAEARMAQNHTTAVVRSDLRDSDQRHPGMRHDPGTVRGNPQALQPAVNSQGLGIQAQDSVSVCEHGNTSARASIDPGAAPGNCRSGAGRSGRRRGR
jgi:S-adenosyl methyltransferase